MTADELERKKRRQEQEDTYLAYRVRYLPAQLEKARIKVRHLENEARRLGLPELIEGENDVGSKSIP